MKLSPPSILVMVALTTTLLLHCLAIQALTHSHVLNQPRTHVPTPPTPTSNHQLSIPTHSPARHFPSKYKYTPEATRSNMVGHATPRPIQHQSAIPMVKDQFKTMNAELGNCAVSSIALQLSTGEYANLSTTFHPATYSYFYPAGFFTNGVCFYVEATSAASAEVMISVMNVNLTNGMSGISCYDPTSGSLQQEFGATIGETDGCPNIMVHVENDVLNPCLPVDYMFECACDPSSPSSSSSSSSSSSTADPTPSIDSSATGGADSSSTDPTVTCDPSSSSSSTADSTSDPVPDSSSSSTAATDPSSSTSDPSLYSTCPPSSSTGVYDPTTSVDPVSSSSSTCSSSSSTDPGLSSSSTCSSSSSSADPPADLTTATASSSSSSSSSAAPSSSSSSSSSSSPSSSSGTGASSTLSSSSSADPPTSPYCSAHGIFPDWINPTDITPHPFDPTVLSYTYHSVYLNHGDRIRLNVATNFGLNIPVIGLFHELYATLNHTRSFPVTGNAVQTISTFQVPDSCWYCISFSVTVRGPHCISQTYVYTCLGRDDHSAPVVSGSSTAEVYIGYDTNSHRGSPTSSPTSSSSSSTAAAAGGTASNSYSTSGSASCYQSSITWNILAAILTAVAIMIQ